MLTVLLKKNTNRLTERLGTWIDDHNEFGEWLSHQYKNENFYGRESHKDKEWIIYKRTTKEKQLTCIDTTQEYQPTKPLLMFSIDVLNFVAIGEDPYKGRYKFCRYCSMPY